MQEITMHKTSKLSIKSQSILLFFFFFIFPGFSMAWRYYYKARCRQKIKAALCLLTSFHSFQETCLFKNILNIMCTIDAFFPELFSVCSHTPL